MGSKQNGNGQSGPSVQGVPNTVHLYENVVSLILKLLHIHCLWVLLMALCKECSLS